MWDYETTRQVISTTMGFLETTMKAQVDHQAIRPHIGQNPSMPPLDPEHNETQLSYLYSPFTINHHGIRKVGNGTSSSFYQATKHGDSVAESLLTARFTLVLYVFHKVNTKYSLNDR